MAFFLEYDGVGVARIIPNPAGQFLRVQWPDEEEAATLRLFDAAGRQLAT